MLNWRCAEPSLDELFGDAAMRLLMQRDGVTESDIRGLLCTLKDARAVALGATKRKPGAIKGGAHMLDLRDAVVSSRAAKSSKAGKTPPQVHLNSKLTVTCPNPANVCRDFSALARQAIDE